VACSGAKEDHLQAKATEAMGAHGSKRRVFVVDDNRDAADTLVMLLNLTGHEACAGYDAGAALASDFGADTFVLDIGLPEMDGYALARALRERHGDGVRLVALTGYGQADDRERSRAAGFDAHLVKPVDLEALRRALAEPASRG
jgi:CheY-like chemotaxis protein